jgi:hypothetical protein
MKKKLFIALLGTFIFVSCKKAQTQQIVSISSLQFTTGGKTIIGNGTYATVASKFTFNYSGVIKGNCGFTMDITVHDGNNTRLPAAGVGNVLGTTATFPNGGFTIDFSGVSMNYLTQVNVVFTPRLSAGDTYLSGHDQITFFVKRTN